MKDRLEELEKMGSPDAVKMTWPKTVGLFAWAYREIVRLRQDVKDYSHSGADVK